MLTARFPRLQTLGPIHNAGKTQPNPCPLRMIPYAIAPIVPIH